MVNPAFVNELLEQVSRLPRHQRTVDTMLKMLSERMMASFLLTDGSLRVLNEATWPHSLGKPCGIFWKPEIFQSRRGRPTSV